MVSSEGEMVEEKQGPFVTLRQDTGVGFSLPGAGTCEGYLQAVWSPLLGPD